jgi:hypothetical protein
VAHAGLTVGVELVAGTGAWAALSDRATKENIDPVDGELILQKPADMPMATWN